MRETMPTRGMGPLLALSCVLILAGGYALHVALLPISAIVFPPPMFFYLFGGLLVLIGLLIWVQSARAVLLCQRRGVLMTEGVYRLCRHSLYGGAICLALTGICLLCRSWIMLLVPPICLGIARLLVIREERWLGMCFGDAYERYRQSTPCLVPYLWRASIPFLAPMRSGLVAPGVWGVNNGVACLFLVQTAEGYLAVDAGRSAPLLRRSLARLGIDPGQVTDVFLTHADPDHTGGLTAFGRARVYLSRVELGHVERRTVRTSAWRHRAPGREVHTLDEGDELDIGGRTVRAIATPGHTPGSMSFLVDGHMLIVGDALVLANGRARHVMRIFTKDMSAHLASIRKLAGVPGVDLLCTAHGGCTANLAQAFCGWHAA